MSLNRHFLPTCYFILIFTSTSYSQPNFLMPGKISDFKSKISSQNYENLKGELKSYQGELAQNKKQHEEKVDGVIQQGFYTGVSYSLISPTFDADSLKNLNQESLGVTVSAGYLYSPAKGWGISMGLGVFQNSKTDKSLPDFVALKPNLHLNFALNNKFYISSGIYVLKWQDDRFKNFISYIGSDYQLGYKVNKKLNIKFGFSYVKIFGEFKDNENYVTSLVSIKGIESQLLYVF